MSDIKQLQEQLTTLRRSFAAADNDYYQALQQFARTQDAPDLHGGALAAPAALHQKKKAREDARFMLHAGLNMLNQKGKPQDLIQAIPADMPFLLLPVRLEARYVLFRHVIRNLKLDDCINAAELSAGGGGGPFNNGAGFERGTHGEWTYQVPNLKSVANPPHVQKVRDQIVKPKSKQYIESVPDRPELCIRIYPDEIFKYALERNLQSSEYEAGKAFWTKVFEGSDPMETDWKRFSANLSPARAAWIARVTEPKNYVPGMTFPAQPKFAAAPPLKDGAYTLPPVANLLPDCFVVRLYDDDGRFKEFKGKPLVEPLHLGLDPTDDPFNEKTATSAFQEQNGQFLAPHYLRWANELDTAEAQGLAIRINLNEHPEFLKGVSKIVALGIKLSANETESARLLEEHFEACIFQENGSEIVKNGTPTNNFEGAKAGFNQKEKEASAYFKALYGINENHPQNLKSDEQYLRSALGLSEKLRFPGGYNFDIDEAKQMNNALWHSTWGYYLLQNFAPDLGEATREQMRQFFNRYVTGRGLLPTLRVNRQPYGIVPTTHWDLLRQEGNDKEALLADKIWTGFLSKLFPIWKAAAINLNAVPTGRVTNGSLNDDFLEMLKLGASSGVFLEQMIAGEGVRSILQKQLDFINFRLSDAGTIGQKMQNLQAQINANNTKINSLKAEKAELSNRLSGIPSHKISVINTLLKNIAEKQKDIDALEKRNKELQSERAALQLELDKQRQPLLQHQIRLRQAIDSFTDPKLLLGSTGLDPKHFQALRQAHQAEKKNLRRFLIDSIPASEELKAELIAGKKWNYVEWLLDASLLDIWENRTDKAPDGDGEAESAADRSLFALLARQSLLRAVLECGLKDREPNPALWLLKARDFELEQLQSGTIISFNPKAPDAKNLLHLEYMAILNKMDGFLPGKVDLFVNRRNYLQNISNKTLKSCIATFADADNAKPLTELLTAFETVKDLPTARLERLITEHLDLCSHRLDAWMLGLAQQRLEKQRAKKPTGIQIGAFGYLLRLIPKAERDVVIVHAEPNYIAAKPENFSRAAIPVISFQGSTGKFDLAKNPERAFFYIGDSDSPRIWLNLETNCVEPDFLVNKPKSDGFLHAHSLTHATTAAIMRAGYLAHPSETMHMSLTPGKVHKALHLIEGVQAGASPTEMLGHLFERNLREAKLEAYRMVFRRAFPLKPELKNEGKLPLLSSLDGLEVVKKMREASKQTDPTKWLNGLLNEQNQPVNIPVADKQALHQIAKKLDEDYVDATADLLLTESIYQTIRGNADRAAAALRTLNTGGQALLPEVVQTQHKGHGLTHRVAIVFPKTAANDTGKVWTSKSSPRATTTPSLNKWLARQLPLPASICIAAKLPNGKSKKVKISDLDIEPIDLLYMLPASFKAGATSVLHALVQEKILSASAFKGAIPEAPIEVDFKSREGLSDAELCLFEISALVLNLKKMIEQSRSLTLSDMAATGNVQAGKLNLTSVENALKAQAVTGGPLALLIQNLKTGLFNLQKTLSESQESQAVRNAAFALCGPLAKAAFYGIEEAASEGVVSFEAERTVFLIEKAEKVADILAQRTADLNAVLNNLPNDEAQRNAAIQSAAELLFGKGSKVWPQLEPANANGLKIAYSERAQLQNTTPEDLDVWMTDAAKVRKPLRYFRQVVLLREVFSGVADGIKTPQIIQLPFTAGKMQPWIGGKVSEAELESIPPVLRPNTSILIEAPDEFDPTKPFSGILLDGWPELIPSKTSETSVAFQYDQPNTEPPQVMLLATSPVETGNWQWQYLIGAVEDALDLSRCRLVTPELLKEKPVLGQLLPAVILPYLSENQNLAAASLL